MFLSVITAPIILARIIDFLIRRCHVNRKSYLANSIRHAYSRYEYVADNTICVVTVSPYWLKLASLRLFVETIPIYKAVASGNGNIEFTVESTRSSLK
jgi:hypothetical protein